jgi:CDP-diacylglycerol pyrophosphatase
VNESTCLGCLCPLMSFCPYFLQMKPSTAVPLVTSMVASAPRALWDGSGTNLLLLLAITRCLSSFQTNEQRKPAVFVQEEGGEGQATAVPRPTSWLAVPEEEVETTRRIALLLRPGTRPPSACARRP